MSWPVEREDRLRFLILRGVLLLITLGASLMALLLNAPDFALTVFIGGSGISWTVPVLRKAALQGRISRATAYWIEWTGGAALFLLGYLIAYRT